MWNAKRTPRISSSTRGCTTLEGLATSLCDRALVGTALLDFVSMESQTRGTVQVLVQADTGTVRDTPIYTFLVGIVRGM